MIRERFSKRIEKERTPCRGTLLGGALAVVAAGVLLGAAAVPAADGSSSKTTLLVGAATADITPKLPAALTGFQTVRIACTIQSPLTANVLALESRQGERTLVQAINSLWP